MSQHLAVTLSPETRQQLLDMTRKGNPPARVQNRARILLLADKNQQTPKTQEQIAQALSVCRPTVGNICRSFIQAGIESALYEKPRPGKSPKITGDVEAQLTLLACSTPPAGRTRWTMQMLANTLVDSISDSAVCDRLKKTRSNRGRVRGSAWEPLRPAMSPKWKTC